MSVLIFRAVPELFRKMASPKKTVTTPTPATDDNETLFVKAMPALFVFLWSSGFVISKFGLPYAPPLTFLLWRYAAAIILLLPIVYFFRARWPASFEKAIHIAVAGVLVHAIYLGGVWCAIKGGMPAGLTALIVGLQPVLTAFAGHWIGERVSGRQWIGFLLGFVGVAMVVANKIALTGLSEESVVFCVLALFGITVGTLYQKRFCPHFDLRTGALLQYVASFLVTLPFAWALEDGHIDWTPQMFFALSWLVLALSLGAIFLLLVLIRRGAATRVVSLFYLTPPTTALMAWIMFGEALSKIAIVGMVVAVLGVAMVVRKPS